MSFFIFIIVVAVLIGIAKIMATNKKNKSMENELVAIDNFNPTHKIIGTDGTTGLAIDVDRKEICLIKNSLGKTTSDIKSYRDIISAELFEDGNTVTRSSRSSQIGGMAIGGLALGGLGAIIGGLSGKKKTTNKVNRIDLIITINSIEACLVACLFLEKR